VPGLVRGKAPVIDLAVLEAELSGFLSALVRGDWLAVNAPEGMRQIRDIAFSGNGEPTSAEAFTAAIDVVVRLRAAFGLDDVPLRLITNGSLMAQARVQAGLDRLAAAGGEVWFKVDAGEAAAIERINGVSLDPQALSRHLSICAAHCPTWVQTCMFRWDGEVPSAAFIDAYLEVLLGAGPERLQGVLLYGIARPSMQVEASHLSPLSAVELEQIADRIKQKGLTVRVSP